MLIKNVRVFTPDGRFEKGGVRISGDRIEEVFTENDPADPSPDEEVIDGNGDMLLPGMVDLHFHGADGGDLNDGTVEALDTIASYEAKIGVTSICPATMTIPVPELMNALEAACRYHKDQLEGEHSEAAMLEGVSMEGPFLSRARRGAQDAKNMLPRSKAVFDEFQSVAGGLVKILTIAPEEEGIVSAPEFIKAVLSSGGGKVHVAIGHSNAEYELAREAFDAGADHVIQLFNAMPGLGHRKPGIIGAAAEDPRVTAELICDGIHVHPSAVKAAFSLFGDDRIIMISDSIRATGKPDGSYFLGGLPVNVSGKLATLAEGGAIAGSVTPLPDCVREVVSMGIPLESAIRCSTMNPAKKLGIDDVCGSIEPGKRADLVIWDNDLELKKVILRGRLL